MKFTRPILALTVGVFVANLAGESLAAPRPKTKKKATVEKPEEPVVEESTAAEIEESEGETSGASGSPKKKKAKKTDSNSSVGKRQNLKLELLLDVIGFTPSPTSGVSVGYFFTPNQVISGRYGIATGVTSSMDEKILSIDLKSFWGNSFYTRAGFSKRDYDFSWDVYPTDAEGNIGFETETLTAKTSSMGLELGLGNQWQWSSFTIGADWVGVYLPLTSSGTDEVVSPDGLVASGLFSSVDDDVKYAKTSQLAFVRFYLGFAF